MKRLCLVLLISMVLAAPSNAETPQGGAALQPWIDTYVYAYPLVLTDMTRRYTQQVTGAGNNEFFRGRLFAEAASKDPDDNSVASAAWLDLSKEPVVFHMPDFGTRYYIARLTDGWAVRFAVLRAGTADKGGHDFAIVGPRWIGTLPYGVTRVASATNMALLQVRLSSNGTVADIAGAYALLERMSLTPLSLCEKPDGPPPLTAPPGTLPAKTPSEQIRDMDGRSFFTYFAGLLASNPPAPSDLDAMAKLAASKIVPAPGFDFDRLDSSVKDGISQTIETALARIFSPSLPRASNDARLDPDPRAFYLARAHDAFVDLAMSPPDNMDRAESEETVSVENKILFRPEGHKSNETDFDIRDDIMRGQKFLSDKVAGYTQVLERKVVTFLDGRGRRKEKVVTTKIVRPNFLLAVEDLKERKIRQVLITDRGCVTEGFVATKSRDNGVGSRFEVTYPKNMAILALRTTVRADESGLKEVVYTPYGPEIDTWQVRKAGLDYLTERIKLARSDLMAKKVRLVGFQQFDDTPVEISLVLSIIEHIDPERFEHYKGNEIALVHEVLAIIGANTTAAYSYSKSSAGARGLFQLLPDTYRRLREKYRNAGLKKDFVLGCNDHTNAAKASLLLFDSDLANLPRRWISKTEKDGRTIGMYLAAAYNCGSARVEKSARQCKGQWTCLLPEETRIYLKKFEVVWSLRDAFER